MGWIGPAISAGAGILGSVMGGNGGDKYPSLKDRWGKHLWGDIIDIQKGIVNQDPLSYFEGQTYADLDPLQIQAYTGMGGFGGPGATGGLVEDAALMAGLSGIDSLNMGNDYLSQIMGGGSPQFGPGGVFDQVYGNPNLPGMVDAATRDITRNLEWNTLPGIDMAASASGNMASSRAGVAEGVARGMAGDRVADVTADIYNNAFNEATRAALMQDQTALRGASNFGQLGMTGLGSAYDAGSDNLQLMLGGGTGFQNQQQRMIDDDVARWNFNQAAPMNHYANQINLLSGTTASGGGPVTPQMNNPHWMDRAMQGAQFGLGLYDAFTGVGNQGMDINAPMFTDAFDSSWSNFLGQNPYDPGNPFGTDWSIYEMPPMG